MTTNNVSEQVEILKNQGNQAFSDKNFKLSIEKFSEAISVEPTNGVFYSNRSAAFACLQQWEEALDDAERAIKLKPDWSKGYGRKGAALQGMQRHEEALQAYQDGLRLEPHNQQLVKARDCCQAQLHSKSTNVDDMFSNVLRDPKLFEKLSQNPKTAAYLADPMFCSNLSLLQQNPASLMTIMKGDKRVMEAVFVAMGIQTMSPEEATESMQRDNNQDMETKEQHSSCSPHSAASNSSQEQGNMGNTQRDDKQTKDPKIVEAEREKELGNAAYKKRDFDAAMNYYQRAFELDSTNMSYLLNQSAVLFEQSLFEDCIRMCEKAVEVGREFKADFKNIAKAFARIGTAYHRLEDLDAAIKHYNKSLTEHRTSEVLEKLKAVELEKQALAKKAYHDPSKAEEERSLGNDLFKQGKFAEAIKHFTEAIKRDESDPRAYSNRAACYTKLAAVPEGLKDCETAIKLDAMFVKAYIRKASLLMMKRDYSEALEACKQAEVADVDKKHIKEIHDLKMKIQMEHHSSSQSMSEEERLRKASQDPEVVNILKDPAMQLILQQMQSDPRAAADHLKNPMVNAKIRKLIDAGVIKMA